MAVTSIILRGLLAGYAALWFALAVAPVDRQDWMLENILTVIMVGCLVATYRAFRFSNVSYVLIAVFMAVHAVGAHYTYAKVPAGFWMQHLLDLQRNHFDRIAHFAFGLLLTYPLRELFRRLIPVTGFWSYYVPFVTAVAFSGSFEIIESWVAQIVSPELGTAYLGTQGDIWDAQQDMTAALIGAFLCMAATAIAQRGHPRPPRSS